MATKCKSIGIYDSLQYCKGKTLLPGVKTRVYAVAKRNISAWPTLPEIDGITTDGLATYNGSFTLKDGETFVFIDLLDNTGELTWETQGDKPCRTFLNKITLNHPQIGASALAFQRQAIADDLVYIVEQRDRTWRVLGNEHFDTDTKPKGSSGKEATSAGDMGSQFEIEVTDVCPAPYYEGTLAIKDEDGDNATLDCLTGEVTKVSEAFTSNSD